MEQRKIRLRWILLAIILGVMGTMTAAGVFVWWKTRDLSVHQATIVEHVKRVTGRDLQTKSGLRFGWSLRPSAIAEGVTLSNASWGSRAEMLRARRITIHLDLPTLLLGNLKIGRIEIEGADLLIEHNANGESNLDMAPTPTGSGPHASEHRSMRLRAGPTLPWIGNLDFVASTIAIAGGEDRAPVTFTVERATLVAPNATTPMQGRLVGRIDNGGRFELEGAAGSFDGWLKGLPGRIDLRGTLGAGTLAIEGSVTAKGTALSLKADGPDLAALSGFARVALPSVGPFSTQAKLTNLRTGYKLEIPSLKIGDGEFAGEVSLRTDRFGRKVAAATFESARLDLAELRRAIPAASGTARSETPAAAPAGQQPGRSPAPSPGGDARLLPSTPLPVDLLQRWNATLTLKIGEVLHGPLKITSAAVTVGLSGGRLIVRPSGTVGAGSATADLVYDVSGKVPTGTLAIVLNKVSAEEILSMIGMPDIVREAGGDFELRMRGSGRTLRDLVISASGSLDVTLGPGRLVGPHTHFVGTEWRRLAAAKDGEDLAWNCLALRGDIAGGTANVRRMVVDLAKAIAVGGGYLHSRSETLEFILAPEPRDLALMAVSLPIRVKANAARITSEIDPAAAKGIHLYPGPKPAPSLVGSIATPARGTGPAPNLCAGFVQRLDTLRPNLRSQLPTPPVAAPERGRRQR